MSTSGKPAPSSAQKRPVPSRASSDRNGVRASIFWTKKNEEKEKQDWAIAPSKKRVSPYRVGATYKGGWKNNKKHGFGVQIWDQGNKYEGEWANGKRSGSGMFWQMEGKRLRKVYSGKWKKGLKNGPGVYFYKNGDRYEGEWREGVREGKGTLFTKGGDQYSGNWRQDRRNGFGRLVKANGDVYRGRWLNDKREGNGIYYYKAKKKIYDGEWVNDMPKCGIYSDAKEYLAQGSHRKLADQLESKFEPIPSLRLKDPNSLLIKRIGEIERERFAARNIEYVELSKQFTESELDEMRDIYSAADSDGNGQVSCLELKQMLVGLGLPVSDVEVAAIMVDLDKNKDAKLSFKEFVSGVHLTKYQISTQNAEPAKDSKTS